MSERQAETNAAAIRNLAARLTRMGYDGNADAAAEDIARGLDHDGWRPLDKPPHPQGPGSTPEARKAALEATASAVRAAKAAR